MLFAGMYQIREANQMVEEFMLAANVSVVMSLFKGWKWLCGEIGGRGLEVEWEILIDWVMMFGLLLSFVLFHILEIKF